MTTTTSIAIIGAGLSSLSLVLALLHPSRAIVPASAITVYEARSSDEYSHSPENASGVVLTPNGLAILDKLRVLEHIRDKCWTSEYRTFKDREAETTRKARVAGEETYGYANHRLWRKELQGVLREMVEERGVKIEFDKRYEGIVEQEAGVAFNVSGVKREVGMLVGADGIYSTVRKYLDPEVGPEYMGTFGVLGHIRYDEVEWPEGFGEKQFTIQDKPGGIFMIPEDRNGTEGMVGLQKSYEGLKREDWESLGKDKDRLMAFYRESYDDWGETTRKIIDAVGRNKSRLYAWPFLRLPKMKRWYSEQGRVVLIGDAAHAMPPSSGQGVNQALEDVWTLTMLLASGKDVVRCLEFWQAMRQRRINDVLEQGMGKANMERLPEKDREKLMSEGKIKEAIHSGSYDDMAWLYKPDSEERIQQWLEEER
jgi:2-polyprenyl-6-methoxyphenol hydroxylase-like FAD-dependent oxidoreductase